MGGRVAGKVAIVTGGASGIGRAAVIQLAREGAAVVIGDIDEKGGEETVQLTGDEGGRALFIRADVTVPLDVERLVKVAVDTYGRLDILHNNAFWTKFDRPVTKTTDDEWEQTLDVSLKGAFLGCRAAIPAMVETGGGSIVNMSSVAATKSSPQVAAYSAAKAGILGLTRSVAFDYGRDGIRANAVVPGTVVTPATEPILSDDGKREYLASKLLVGRLGTPEDIAWAVLYLASDESSFLTGQALVVDGGRMLA